LSTSVQKQLLEDIESAGGIASNFRLRDILNSKSDVYGPPHLAQRRSVQNKVDDWKRKSSNEYLTLLAAHRVQPYAVRNDTAPQAAQSSPESLVCESLSPAESSAPSEVELSSPDSSVESESFVKSPAARVQSPRRSAATMARNKLNLEDSKFQ
jgi:hypothetical protein